MGGCVGMHIRVCICHSDHEELYISGLTSFWKNYYLIFIYLWVFKAYGMSRNVITKSEVTIGGH